MSGCSLRADSYYDVHYAAPHRIQRPILPAHDERSTLPIARLAFVFRADAGAVIAASALSLVADHE